MFLRDTRPQDDFGDEIRSHIELEIDSLRAQGLSEKEAEARARRRFGNVTRAQEQFYESSRWQWADTLWRNVRFGIRMMLRNPGSSLVAVLVLTLGIGASTAIFTLINAVILRNLPVQRPEQLVLFGTGKAIGSSGGFPSGSSDLFSYDMYRDFRDRNSVFSNVTAVDSIIFDIHGRVADGDLEKISVQLASGTFFRTLGVQALSGRTLNPSDDVTQGGHPVAVASYAWWRKRFGSTNPIGSSVTIIGTVYRIVGVMPPDFFGVVADHPPDFWIPLSMEKEISPDWNGLDKGLFQSLYLIARKRPGVSVEQATANTTFLYRQTIRGYTGPQPSKKQLEDISHAQVQLTSGATGLSRLRLQFSSSLLILMAAAGLVLLIACTNVANLLLARSSARQQEIAIRISTGASRAQLIRQLFIEGGVLGLTGATLGIALSWAAGKLLLQMVSPGGPPLAIDILPDAHVLGFVLLLTLCTVLLFAILPALRATGMDLTPSLKEGRGITKSRLARGLVVGQVALSLALMSGAVLFLRSLVNLMNIDTGFDRHNVLRTTIDPAAAGYRDDPRLHSMMRQVEEQVDAIPGVQATAFCFTVFSEGSQTQPVTVPGRPASDRDAGVEHNVSGVQYLKAMGMPILLGRGLNENDTASSRRVAVINETLARDYFGGGSPLGREFSVGADAQWRNIEVIGVARDAKYDYLTQEPTPAAFYPESQHNGFLSNLVIRYLGTPERMIPQIRRAVASVDRNLPLGDFQTMDEIVNASMTTPRVLAELCAVFAALAALLACVGIYGVMSYGIARRTNELGLRMAMGAKRADVLWMVLREIIVLALIGIVIGLTVALLCGRLVSSVLFGLTPTDPFAIAMAASLMVFVALLAGWLPARRATQIDPMVALRHE